MCVRALSSVVVFPLYPGEGCIKVGLSASEADPSAQTSDTRLVSVVLALPTQQLALNVLNVTRTTC